MKKFLSLALIFVLIFSLPAQAAAKKVTAVECQGEAPLNYPRVTVGTTRVTSKCKVWNICGCLRFVAPKAGTYKFTLKNPTTSLAKVDVTALSPLADLPGNLHLGKSSHWKGSNSGTRKFAKGETVYLSLFQWDAAGNYTNGKLTLVIKKVK